MKLISFKSLVLIFNLPLSTTSSRPLESVRKNWTFMLEMVQIKIFYYYLLLLYIITICVIYRYYSLVSKDTGDSLSWETSCTTDTGIFS